MRIKVCGMRAPENLTHLLSLDIDYVGLIFYQKSKRFVKEELPNLDFKGKQKVGVFVNADLDYISEKKAIFDFQFVQLHGDENVEFCQKLKAHLDIKIIKAFSVDQNFDFSSTSIYEPFCDYFLFDTKGELPGGNGYTFDWHLLENYTGDTPFFLSGGISKNHLEELKLLKFKQLYAIDLNSGFELEPGLKDISLLENFIKDVKTTNKHQEI